jgi:hypothetical protein
MSTITTAHKIFAINSVLKSDTDDATALHLYNTFVHVTTERQLEVAYAALQIEGGGFKRVYSDAMPGVLRQHIFSVCEALARFCEARDPIVDDFQRTQILYSPAPLAEVIASIRNEGANTTRAVDKLSTLTPTEYNEHAWAQAQHRVIKRAEY